MPLHRPGRACRTMLFVFLLCINDELSSSWNWSRVLADLQTMIRQLQASLEEGEATKFRQHWGLFMQRCPTSEDGAARGIDFCARLCSHKLSLPSLSLSLLSLHSALSVASLLMEHFTAPAVIVTARAVHTSMEKWRRQKGRTFQT